ncbi:alpha/beta hydrolase [Temperatibacter marinus]|uniref:Alpha/beta hydrolase n=1 Tax=Temperatibacter marinus TaxID=1456591 RepID=A0AA52EJ71_9PROT|nr:alpha/beta hydrolase [Temperatibacter marinus]WND03507.1 alpha/beta hydrolase [Temperatibacter marinus]
MKKLTKAYLQGRDGAIHIRKMGSPKNPTLILLHQVPSHGGMFEALMDLLCNDFFCVAIDLPGFGESEMAQATSIEDFAACIWPVIEDVCKGPVHILGHHTGTSVAIELAVSYPEAIASLILSGPALITEDLKALLPTISYTIPYEKDGAHHKKMWQRIVNKDKDGTLPAAVIEREVQSALSLGDHYQHTYLAASDYALIERLPAVQCPTLVFAGTLDILYPAVAPVVRALKGAEQAEIIGGDGYIFDKKVDDIERLCSVFLKAHSAQ